MMKIKIALLAAGAFCAASLAAGSASAMPVGGLAGAASEVSGDLQQARWVCGPYRCFWRPGPRFYGRPWWGGPGYYRHYGFYGRPYRPYWGPRFYARSWWGGY
jgi:hypothetical protein